MVGKVVKNTLGQHLLIVRQKGSTLTGLPFTDADQQAPVEAESDQVQVVAETFEEFVSKTRHKKWVRSFIGRVCKNEQDELGVVEGYQDRKFHGVGLDGSDWSSREPRVISGDLYTHFQYRLSENG